jgi:hypothetical protein
MLEIQYIDNNYNIVMYTRLLMASTSRNMEQDTIEINKLVAHSWCEQTFGCCVVTDKA